MGVLKVFRLLTHPVFDFFISRIGVEWYIFL